MRPRPQTLRAIRPNLGVRDKYQSLMTRLIAQMSDDVKTTIARQYETTPPEMAQDASPARDLADVVRRLRAKWTRRFRKLAPDMAKIWATSTREHVDANMRAALRKAGFTVNFQVSREVNDILQASVVENVSLIKSIPDQYFTQIQGSVMRSVQTGIDLHTLTREIEAHDGVTRRRAVNIARDQTNKATAVINRARQLEVGFKQARWLHSAGGKTPRPSHVKAGRDGVIYDIAEGWFDPDAKVRCWPGTLINCRCVAIPIIPSMSDAVQPIAA